MQKQIPYEDIEKIMQLEVTYAEIEKIVNYYFDKKEFYWSRRKPMEPISRKELEKNLLISDEKIIKIQKEYLHLGSKRNPIIIVDKDGCLLIPGIDERTNVLNAIYNEFMSNSDAVPTVKLSKKAHHIIVGAEVLA